MFPPFRAEHIGSLLWPPELLATRRAFDGGEGARYCLSSSLDKLKDIAVRIFYHRDARTRADLSFWNSELNAFAFEFGTQVGQALDHEGDVTNAELFL